MLLKLINIHAPCCQLSFIKWLQGHLLICPFKYITGIDCPGCGFQRSVLALFDGDMHQSFVLYPATIPLLLFFAYGIADRFLHLDTKKEVVKKSAFMIIGTIILVSYAIKMYKLYGHYSISA
ncbi:MAG: DUF2752 domain-containing protein [Sphingobacteriales bacterium]